MTTYIIAALLIAVSIVLWRTNGREKYQVMAILQSVIAIAAFWVIGEDVSSGNGITVFGILSGILVLHFVISRFWKKKNAWFPPVFILISSAALFLFQDDVFIFSDFPVSLTKLPVFLLPVLGAMIVPIADLKEKVLGDFFNIDYKNRRGISRAVYVFLIGFFLFLGHFTANYIGISLVVAGFGANLLYNQKSGALWNMYLGLIGVLLIGHFGVISQFDNSNLLMGRVLEGVFFGGFVSLFVNTMGRAKKQKLVATILSWFLIISIPSVLLFLGVQNVNLGGPDAVIGLMVGFAFAAFLGINTRNNSSLLGVYFALGILLLPLTINKEAEDMTKISIPGKTEVTDKKEKDVDVFDNPGKEIDIESKFNINGENSQMTFKLGPKGGVTKGAFKSFSGEFDLAAKKINLELPVNQLTTFVKMRDKELMGDGYFNEPKFPTMTYVSNTMEYVGDKYLAKGKFTMMGISVDKEVEMKYLGKIGVNDAPVFVGKAQVDRTKHGMKSDPTEGDVVDMTFKIELK